jgi:membrane peptidoglycan carboxypeptidase
LAVHSGSSSRGDGVVTDPKPGETRKTGYRRLVDYPRWGRSGWRAFVPSWRLVAGLCAAAFLALVTLVLVVYALVKVPNLNNLSLPTATVYEYADGTPFYTAGLQNRVLVSASQIPPVVEHAVVAIENPTFYTDAGISPRGILRALVNDLKGEAVQGGSTITQQFVKNAYLTDKQTLGRKLQEIFTSVKITRAYTKAQILNDYLNTVYFGRGSYGIQAAAETYFGLSVRQVTSPGQAAYLAALVNEPTVLSGTDPADQALLRQRWNLVLDDMVKDGYLTRAQRATVTWPSVLAPRGAIITDANGVDDSAMAHAADGYLDQLHAANPQIPDAATAHAGGDVIVTTFTRSAMTAAVRAVREALYDRLRPQEKGQAAVDQGVQVGLATVDVKTGELLGFYPGNSDFNNATQAQITPGSQMGMFAKAARMSGSGTLWGLMDKIGLTRNLIDNPAELPEPLRKLETDPSLALGIAPESPARIAAAFAVFPNGGMYHDLAMIGSVTVEGHQIWSYNPTGVPVLHPDVSRAFGMRFFSDFGVPGTIGGDHTAWFTGYSGGTVTAVALWDQTTNASHQVVQQSLDGLGGVPAKRTVDWPVAIWEAAITPANSQRQPIPQSQAPENPQIKPPAITKSHLAIDSHT